MHTSQLQDSSKKLFLEKWESRLFLHLKCKSLYVHDEDKEGQSQEEADSSTF